MNLKINKILIIEENMKPIWSQYFQKLLFFEHLAKKLYLKVEYLLLEFSFKLRLIRILFGKRIFRTFLLSHLCILMHMYSEKK